MSNHFIVLIIVLVVAAVGATIVIIWAAKAGSKKTPKEIESQKKAEEYANNKVTVIKVGNSYPQPISKYVTQYDFERRSSYGANLPQKRDRVMCFNGKLVFKGPESEMSLFDKLYLKEVIKNLFAIKELGQEVIEDKINILLGTKIDRNKNKIFLDLASFLKLDNYYVYLFHNNGDEVCEYLNYFCKTRASVYKNLPETRFDNNHNNCVAIFDKNLISEEDLRLLCYIVSRKLKTSGAYCESILSPYSVLNKKGIEFENSFDYCAEYVYKAIADSTNCSIFPDTDIAAEIFMRVEGYTGWPAPYELITQLYNLRLEMHNSGYKPLYYHAEADLFNLVKKYYPDAIYQYHHQWLGRQSLDIYIPSIKIAVEFQGKQHYESVGYFGGKSTYQKNAKRDSIKKELCEKQGVKYLEWRYDLEINEDNIIKLLN